MFNSTRTEDRLIYHLQRLEATLAESATQNETRQQAHGFAQASDPQATSETPRGMPAAGSNRPSLDLADAVPRKTESAAADDTRSGGIWDPQPGGVCRASDDRNQLWYPTKVLFDPQSHFNVVSRSMLTTMRLQDKTEKYSKHEISGVNAVSTLEDGICLRWSVHKSNNIYETQFYVGNGMYGLILGTPFLESYTPDRAVFIGLNHLSGISADERLARDQTTRRLDEEALADEPENPSLPALTPLPLVGRAGGAAPVSAVPGVGTGHPLGPNTSRTLPTASTTQSATSPTTTVRGGTSVVSE
jgi:hypothetical protein